MGNPPLWVLRNAIFPHGHRLPKRPPEWQEPKKGATYYPHFGCDANNAFKTKAGNLPNDAYRFWVGSEWAVSHFRKCRACERIFNIEADAIKHLKDEGCTKTLTAAYTALKRDRKCAMCDELTTKETWGVPLCSPLCEHRWKFEVNLSLGLRAAVEFVKMQRQERGVFQS